MGVMKRMRVSRASLNLIVLAVFMLAVNASLGILLTRQASAAMIALIQSRMLDISNTAADMLDGDVLETVTPEDASTPGYEAIMRTLTYFQDNIDLKYIYCIRDMGDGSFAFGLDPTVDDPGEFGSPVVYTDALYRASLGTPAADVHSYQDEWGTFYSAYTPVFNSSGRVAGIVAVDFSAEWYEAQLTTQWRTTLIIGILSLVVGAIVVLTITGRSHRRLRALHGQMNDLAENVEELLREAGNMTSTRPRQQALRMTALRDEGEDIDALGAKILSMQQDLRAQIELMHEQTYMDGLTGVRNVTAYRDAVQELDADIAKGNAAFSVAVFDMNGLKEINDSCGHECGDRALVDAARALKAVFGPEDVYRIGGDEFTAITGPASDAEMKRRFECLEEELERISGGEGDNHPPVCFSKGCAAFSDGDAAFRDVFRRADQQMYEDKAKYYAEHADRRRKRGDG